MYELKPCPFCGSAVTLDFDDEPISGGSVADYVEPPVIWCETCNRTFDLVTGFDHPDGFPTLDDFVTWWNTRAGEV